MAPFHNLALLVLALLPTAVVVGDLGTDDNTEITGGISSVYAEKRQDSTRTNTPNTSATTPVDADGPATVYQLNIACFSDPGDAVCSNPVTCDDPPGAVLYNQLASVGGGPYESIGSICLRPEDVVEEEAAPPVITPALVTEEFKRLDWTPSTLQVQPPGGRTLVNLETNFYTADTAPQTRDVTLLEQAVQIEATPTTWTWHHGDGTTQTTTAPGRAYPALDITHTYTEADTTLSLSLDTTYAGRYRVNGGEWIAIPPTVTITGAPAQLEVVAARPQLVGAG